MAARAKGSAASSPEQELFDLQRKYSLLEGDRKAYYETSQWTIKQNQETLAAAKQEGKDLRAELVKRNNQKAAAGSDADELARLTKYVTELRKRHDEARQLVSRKEQGLQTRVDSVKDLELDAVKLVEGDTPVTQRLKALQARLAASAQRLEETQAQRKTYDQIAKRLREERLGLQNQMHSLERNLASKAHDLEELVRVSHDAAHAKEAAKAELARLEEALEVEALRRERELADRHALWRIKQEMAASTDAAPTGAAKVVPQRAEAAALAALATMRQRVTARQEAGRASEEDGAMTFEAALRKITEATGVSDVDEIIAKFSAAQETSRNLAAMALEAQARMDALNARLDAAKGQAEALKYSGAAPVATSRRELDDLEAQLGEAQAQAERLAARQERVGKLLVALQAGAEHLAARLDAVRDPEDGPPPADVEAALRLCQRKLRVLTKVVNGSDAQLLAALVDPGRLAALAAGPTAEASVLVRRDASRSVLGMSDDEDGEGVPDDEDGEGMDEVLDRSALKSSAERRHGGATRGPGKAKVSQGRGR